MDETGFQLDPIKGWTLCSRGRRTVVAMSLGNREHVTVIEAIAADGYSIPPFYIFKGKRKSNDLVIAVHEQVLCHCFNINLLNNREAQVQHSLLVKRAILQKSSGLCGGNTFVSIADNEMDIHYFSPVMDMAHIVTILLFFGKQNNKGSSSQPFHLIHHSLLQPLDVAVFGPLKRAWKRIAPTWFEGKIQAKRLTVPHSLWMSRKAWKEAISVETIKAGFRATGNLSLQSRFRQNGERQASGFIIAISSQSFHHQG